MYLHSCILKNMPPFQYNFKRITCLLPRKGIIVSKSLYLLLFGWFELESGGVFACLHILLTFSVTPDPIISPFSSQPPYLWKTRSYKFMDIASHIKACAMMDPPEHSMPTIYVIMLGKGKRMNRTDSGLYIMDSCL